jgi:methionyl-tRNA formyltransferase
MKKMILFTNSEYSNLCERAIEILKEKYELIRVFRMNANSAKIENLKNEILEIEQPDIIFNFLSPRIFPEWLIQFPKYGCINFHPASNQYPGVGSAAYAIYNDDDDIGVTAHYISAEIDSGPIIHQLKFPRDREISVEKLYYYALECSLIQLEQVATILETVNELPMVDVWRKKAVTREEFEKWKIITVTSSREEVSRKIKALKHSKYPGPYVDLHGHRFTLLH